MSKDVYQEVADRIISEMEKGIIPWKKPWTGSTNGAISHESGKPYSILNQFLLGGSGEYITFNQCKKEGGHVKKDAKSKMVIFWKVYQKDKKDENGQTIKDEDGNDKKDCIPVLKYFNVFALEDCEGITPKFEEKEERTHADPIQKAEEVFADYQKRSGVKFENCMQDSAFYSPSSDRIVLPLMDQFANSAEYYSTLFHETTHSTGHGSRLNRFSGSALENMFGSDSYSKEELVAEIGSATIMNMLGIETPETFKNSTAYLQSWMKVLKNDPKMIVSAASRAEKAVRLIMNEEKEG